LEYARAVYAIGVVGIVFCNADIIRVARGCHIGKTNNVNEDVNMYTGNQ
jgi:hypothetical protein